MICVSHNAGFFHVVMYVFIASSIIIIIINVYQPKSTARVSLDYTNLNICESMT